MNLGSEAYSTEYVLNTFEYDLSGSAARVLHLRIRKYKEETYDLQALFRPLTHAVLQLKNPSLPKAEIEKTGVGTWGGVPYIYIYRYIYIYTRVCLCVFVFVCVCACARFSSFVSKSARYFSKKRGIALPDCCKC